MTWHRTAFMVLCLVALETAPASAWTLWVKHEVAHVYANRPTQVSRSWDRREAFATFDQCTTAKRETWQGVVSHYADLSRFPRIEKIDTILNEAVFIELKSGDGSLGGQQTQHFHCLTEGMDPRS